MVTKQELKEAMKVLIKELTSMFDSILQDILMLSSQFTFIVNQPPLQPKLRFNQIPNLYSIFCSTFKHEDKLIVNGPPKQYPQQQQQQPIPEFLGLEQIEEQEDEQFPSTKRKPQSIRQTPKIPKEPIQEQKEKRKSKEDLFNYQYLFKK